MGKPRAIFTSLLLSGIFAGAVLVGAPLQSSLPAEDNEPDNSDDIRLLQADVMIEACHSHGMKSRPYVQTEIKKTKELSCSTLLGPDTDKFDSTNFKLWRPVEEASNQGSDSILT